MLSFHCYTISTGRLHAGMTESSASSDPATAEMVAILKQLPSASVFGTQFHMFQNKDIQLLNRYRPSSASTSQDSPQPAGGGKEAERMTRVRGFVTELLQHYGPAGVAFRLDASPPTQV